MSQSLHDYLQAVDHAIVDAARAPEIAPTIQQLAGEWTPLWDVSEEAEELLTVAPYLVRWQPSSPFAEWLLQNGWGQSWGIFLKLRLRTPLEQLRRHFQSLLLVQVEGEPHQYYFRFYDPRVLRVFLETCTLEQAQQFFGSVGHFLTEGDTPTELYQYFLTPMGVKREKIT